MSMVLEIHSNVARAGGRENSVWKGSPDQLGVVVPSAMDWNPPFPNEKGELSKAVVGFLTNVFRRTNRVDAEDVKRLDEAGYNLPSLSVGDIVIVDNTEGVRVAYTVEMFGFAEAGRIIDGSQTQ